MKYSFLVLFITLITSCSHAQNSSNTTPELTITNNSITYEQWKKDALSDIRLYPKFGDVVKNEDQKAADQVLIESYTKQHGGRREGSEVLVGLGFNYLSQGNVKTAMYRFNQAWLLDPENENVFWGYACVYFRMGELDLALAQLNEGLNFNAKSSNILTDMGTIHLAIFHENNDKEDYHKGLDYLKQSYSIDPKNTNTLFKLSSAYLMDGDCSNALKYFNECKTLGSKLITEEYVAAISRECNNK
jgi:tetratricopeptide (TPR) repeat protein